MKFKKFTVSALLLSALLLLSSCGHTHSFGKWQDYGSYQERVCEDCGYIEREYFGDEYKRDDTISKTDETSSDTGKESETAVSPQDLIKVCTRIDVTYVDPSVPRQFGDVPTYFLYKYDNEGNQINETAYTYYDEIANSAMYSMYSFDDNSTGRFTNVRKCVEDGLNVEYRDELYPNDSFGRYDRWKIVYNPDGTPRSEMMEPADTALCLSPGGKYEYFYDDEGLLIRLVQYSVSMVFNPDDGLSYPKFTKYCTYEYTYQTLSQYLAQKGTNSNSGIPNGNGKTGNNSDSGVTPKTCPACLGKKSKECNGCDGKGKVLSYYDINHNPVYSTCPICHGSGSVSCKVCGGDGTIYD